MYNKLRNVAKRSTTLHIGNAALDMSHGYDTEQRKALAFRLALRYNVCMKNKEVQTAQSLLPWNTPAECAAPVSGR